MQRQNSKELCRDWGSPAGYSRGQSCRTPSSRSRHGWLGRNILQPQNMKRNKTAKEPKKQNAGARKRVALEEEDRVKLDRWMTKPEHKVWTMFTKHPHVVYSPCHPFTVSSRFTMSSWSMPSINSAIHSHCHPFTIPLIHHVIHLPCHPYSMSSFCHVIHSPLWSMPSIYHAIYSPCHPVIHLIIHSLCHTFTMPFIHQLVH